MEMRKLGNEELHRLSVAQYREAPKIPVIVVLDNIRSLNNIGSVFRTADAFCIQKIYLCGITATPPHKEIHKTALGQVEVIAIEQVEDAVSLEHFSPKKGVTYALIFGNEVEGVQQSVVSLCQRAIEIPQYGTKHSLNIAVSAGILLWDFSYKIRGLH